MTERSQIQEIKEKLDIVDVASKYIRAPFKRTGRNTFTICPFHSERTPSFSLNSDLGIYKCFGCGEAGDVLTLIEKLEGVDFPKTLEIAAEYAGVKLKDVVYSPQDKKIASEREAATKAHSLATEFFHYLLTKHKAGKSALEYAMGRKIRMEEINLFKIGFAPNGFENLKKYLIKKGFKQEDLVRWGLLVSKNGRIYDKFRNRLVFPIMNHRGEVVGFSGRTLEKDGIPKYLNTSETVLYKKSEVVYGLFHAKDSMRKTGFAIVAEGNIEPLTSRKANLDNVVVPMGTALTLQQLKLIKRYCDQIYFAFDTDEAGFNALLRSLKLAFSLDFNVKVVNLGKYKDPDEMLFEDPRLWINAVESAAEVMDFLMNRFTRDISIRTGQGKSTFVKRISPYLILLKDNIQKEHYTKQIADLINLDVDAVRNAVAKAGKVEFKDEVKKQKKQVFGPIDYLLALIVHHPELSLEVGKSEISFNPLQEKLINLVKTDVDIKQIRAQLDGDEQMYFDKLVMQNVDFDDDERLQKIFKKSLQQVEKHR